MPPPPEGKVYELWLDHEGVGMVPAGLMEADQDQLLLEGDPATATGRRHHRRARGRVRRSRRSAPIALFEFEQA